MPARIVSGTNVIRYCCMFSQESVVVVDQSAFQVPELSSSDEPNPDTEANKGIHGCQAEAGFIGGRFGRNQ
jgi:hypothetical protein